MTKINLASVNGLYVGTIAVNFTTYFMPHDHPLKARTAIRIYLIQN